MSADSNAEPVLLKGQRVYVVDAHSLIFQIFHALPDMSSPRGEHVGAKFMRINDHAMGLSASAEGRMM